MGISFDEAKSILTSMSKLNNLACMELVEVNPCLDNEKNKMAERSFELINSLVKSLK
jgi:arginase